MTPPVAMDPLVHQLLLATVLVSATVVIHLVGLDLLQVILRWHLKRLALWVHLDRKVVPMGIVLSLFALHGVEIWLYALIYWRTGALPRLENALYFSISAYSSLGETGTVLPEGWHVVGALEAINGMLLIGWSTAFLFHILRHLMWEDDDRVLPRGAIAARRKSKRGA
jgi:voltage-gated potassium channel